jgi:formaldehyde-activating enzyme involved in methanogenesis
MRTSRWILLSVTCLLALALGGVWLLGSPAIASAAEITAEDLQTITRSATKPGLLGDGYLTHGGWGRAGFKGIDYQQLLADALGITVEELEAAYEAARTAAIEQAVEEGLITREQADEMLVWGGVGHGGFKFFGFRGFRGGARGVSGSTIDEQALLADALDITVEELQTAREKANEAAIAQAIEKGIITQEQADQMLARKDLMSYLDRDTLLAKALGMTIAELQAAYDEGKTLSDLMAEKELDAATVRENLQEAYAEAIAQAVEDGVITQEQADEMLSGRGLGFRDFGPGMMRAWPGDRGDLNRFPGHGGFRGRGGFGGERPCGPEGEESPGVNFRSRRTIQPDSTL